MTSALLCSSPDQRLRRTTDHLTVHTTPKSSQCHPSFRPSAAMAPGWVDAPSYLLLNKSSARESLPHQYFTFLSKLTSSETAATNESGQSIHVPQAGSSTSILSPSSQAGTLELATPPEDKDPKEGGNNLSLNVHTAAKSARALTRVSTLHFLFGNQENSKEFKHWQFHWKAMVTPKGTGGQISSYVNSLCPRSLQRALGGSHPGG